MSMPIWYYFLTSEVAAVIAIHMIGMKKPARSGLGE